jgi:hypothetical protein
MADISSYYLAYPEDNPDLYKVLVDKVIESLWHNRRPNEFDESTSKESMRSKLDEFYNECEIFILEEHYKDANRYCFLALESNLKSPHVDGKVAEVALLASNMKDKHQFFTLLRRLKEHCRFSGMDWLIIHKHVAPYEYRARYHKL